VGRVFGYTLALGHHWHGEHRVADVSDFVNRNVFEKASADALAFSFFSLKEVVTLVCKI
jgi:hypothetical protein